MPKHNRNNQAGSIAIDVASLVLLILLIAVSVFAYLNLRDKNHYKKDVDKIVASAVASAKTQQTADDKVKFDEAAKLPNKTFTGPVASGSISFSYPKTWSAYIDQSGGQPINGYFHPDNVPGLTSGTAFALRLELVNDSYSSVLQQVTDQAQNGTIKASAYVPSKMKGVANVQAGTLLTGSVAQDGNGHYFSGQELIISVRDKTLKLYTLSNNYAADFNKTVLSSLTFKP